MEYKDPSLTLDCLLHVFSFLTEEDLIRVSCVCKEWHQAAETQWLWREMCLRRWRFCNVTRLLTNSESSTWKRYYLHRSALERNMKSGRSGGDYSCKSLRGHTGRIVGLAYLMGNDALEDMWKFTPVVCSASSDGTIKAWNVQTGMNMWSSLSVNPLTHIITDVEQDVVITADSVGTVSTWRGRTGDALSSFSSGSSPGTIMTFNPEGKSVVMVGTSLGSLLALTSPHLSEISRRLVSDSFPLHILLSSPDKKWILTAASASAQSSPTVFSTQSVCSPVEDEAGVCESVCVSLPVTGCVAAAFFPSQPARVAVVHKQQQQQQQQQQHNTLSVFQFNLKKSKYKQEAQAQQLESFRLSLNSGHSDVVLRAKGNNVLLLTDANLLKVYSLTGQLISCFQEHLEPITSVCVDDFRVVTASRDLSLRVLTWRRDGDKGQMLESQYQLLGGSHSMSRGFTAVACDYASIVGSVEGVDGKDVLKAYVFNS